MSTDDLDLIWNRACNVEWDDERHAADVHLRWLVAVDGLAKEGGLVHAARCLEPAERPFALAAFSYFGLADLASLFERATKSVLLGRDDDELDERYAALTEGDRIRAAFRAHHRTHADRYAPVSESTRRLEEDAGSILADLLAKAERKTR